MDNCNISYGEGLLSGIWRIYGKRENCSLHDNNIITTKDCNAAAEHIKLKNFEFSFLARAPKEETQVEIWASFRQVNQENRYMLGVRGGAHKHIYLARLGAKGYDKMLALVPLEYSPAPGIWYSIRVICAGNKIAVYYNNESMPRICCADDKAPFNEGSISVGGGYLRAEYKDIIVKKISEDALEQVEGQQDFLKKMAYTEEMKELIRRKERGMYRPFSMPELTAERAELTLDGKWLLVPGYEEKANPQTLNYDDSEAHVITVPSSWNPLLAWLEGETMKNGMSKGQSDNYHLEEYLRCMNQTFDYQKTDSAWYRQYLDLPCGIENKHVVLDFEGISLTCRIFFNENKVYENIGMFTPIQVDISKYVHAGRNILAIEVFKGVPGDKSIGIDTRLNDFNYAKAREAKESVVQGKDNLHREFCAEDVPHGIYCGSPTGIWRSAKLIVTDKVYVKECWFRPTLKDASIEVTCINGGDTEKTIELSYSLIHKTTGECLCEERVEDVHLIAQEEQKVTILTPKVSPRLWAPGTPNLYWLRIKISSARMNLDEYQELVGFRTVGFDKSTLIYNGKPMWVRGGNLMPAHIKPNDKELARKYMETALKHNLMATRTHVSPWTDIWLDAADEYGIMVSFEGTWPWLMIETIPSELSLEIWKSELCKLLHRHRNRPSLFMLTLNNEMNFYLLSDSDEVVKEKGALVQGGIRVLREEIPDLPVICDSGYFRGPTMYSGRYKRLAIANGRYERIIEPNHYDDGDADDPHFYFGWYEPDFFHFMNGEFGRDMTLENRPCILQECSVGYSRAEDGGAVRDYLFNHQTPQTTTGKRAYEHNDPCYFQHNLSFQIQGLVEMFRRVEHSRTCGVLMFSFETWFYYHHDSLRIQPAMAVKQLKMAYQPVLASADLRGRHFYSGEKLSTTITLINDNKDYVVLNKPKVIAQIAYKDKVIASAEVEFENVSYFETPAKVLSISIPNELPCHCTHAKLILKVLVNEDIISNNEYDILLADDLWAKGEHFMQSICYLKRDEAACKMIESYGLKGISFEDFDQVTQSQGRFLIMDELHEGEDLQVRMLAERGWRIIMLNQKGISKEILRGKMADFTEDQMEIMTMNIPESSVFDGIDEFDTAWFANGTDVPYAAYGRYDVDRMDADVYVLGETLQWHNYIPSPTEYYKMGGTPLFSLKAGNGAFIFSAIRTDANDSDPVASRLNHNILTWNFDEA